MTASSWVSVFANTSFGGARMRSVGNSGRMQRNMAFFNIVSTHKITIHIIQHFITVNIAVIIWCRNAIWMIIVQSRNKATNYKRCRFESLMYRGRLMHASCDGFEIVNRECVWEIVPVLSHNIKRMRGIDHFNDFILLLHFHQEFSFFVERF